MVRTHCTNTDKPIILRDVSAETGKGAGCYKPVGFWYEVDGDWQRWTDAEDFGCGDHIFSVSLNSCNVLILNTLAKLDRFNKRFAVGEGRYHAEIDWASVKHLYDGLEIAPYRWERRLEINWYYGWDCASGIIWRPKDAVLEYIGVRAEKAVAQ